MDAKTLLIRAAGLFCKEQIMCQNCPLLPICGEGSFPHFNHVNINPLRTFTLNILGIDVHDKFSVAGFSNIYRYSYDQGCIVDDQTNIPISGNVLEDIIDHPEKITVHIQFSPADLELCKHMGINYVSKDADGAIGFWQGKEPTLVDGVYFGSDECILCGNKMPMQYCFQYIPCKSCTLVID